MTNVNRRTFMLGLGSAGIGLAVGPVFASVEGRRKLKILVLGGTRLHRASHRQACNFTRA